MKLCTPRDMSFGLSLSLRLFSPARKVIHQVRNSYTQQQQLTDPSVIRVGRFKLILGEPGDAAVRQWYVRNAPPPPARARAVAR